MYCTVYEKFFNTFSFPFIFRVPYDRSTLDGAFVHYFFQNSCITGFSISYNCCISFFVGFVFYLEAFCVDFAYQFERINTVKKTSGEKLKFELISAIHLHQNIEW